jgi:O-antigen ligase
MDLRASLQKLYFPVLCVSAFVIPLPFIFSSVSLILLSAAWAVQFNPALFAERLRQRKALWIWIAFYLLHVVSYFYSEDKGQAGFDLETKMSFILLPVIIGTGPAMDKRRERGLLFAFILGMQATAIICLAKALMTFVSAGATSQFFYHELVFGFNANAVYFAWYTVFSLIALMFYPWKEHSVLSRRWVYLLFFSLQAAFLVLLSSRLLLVVFLFIVIPAYFFREVRKSGLVLKRLFIAGAVLLALVCGVLFTDNPVKNRFGDVLKNNSSSEWLPEQGQPQRFNNMTLRFFLWKMAFDNIRDHNLWLTGCGNGDVKILQEAKMKATPGYDRVAHPRLWEFNLHNMYLQTLMMIGLPGLLMLIAMVFLPVVSAIRAREHVAFALLHIISGLFMMQEAAFQTQAGIIFFSFFSIVFWNIRYGRKEIS